MNSFPNSNLASKMATDTTDLGGDVDRIHVLQGTLGQAPSTQGGWVEEGLASSTWVEDDSVL